MLHSMFTIYDSKTAAYLPPFFQQTKPSAIRAISDTVNDPNHAFHKHPEDYTLFYLGTFEDNSCQFDLEDTPQSLCVCLELLEQNHSA